MKRLGFMNTHSNDFLSAASLEGAQNLCSAAFPKSELYSLHVFPDDLWVAEIRYDNILHEGAGTSEASALANAISVINAALRGGQQDEHRLGG